MLRIGVADESRGLERGEGFEAFTAGDGECARLCVADLGGLDGEGTVYWSLEQVKSH